MCIFGHLNANGVVMEAEGLMAEGSGAWSA